MFLLWGGGHWVSDALLIFRTSVVCLPWGFHSWLWIWDFDASVREFRASDWKASQEPEDTNKTSQNSETSQELWGIGRLKLEIVATEIRELRHALNVAISQASFSA